MRAAEAVVRSTADDVPCSPTLHGRFLFTLLIVGAEYERNLVWERTLARLEAVRRKGRRG